MSGQIRVFIAVPVPELPQLEPVFDELRSAGGPVKCVSAANLHLTLKFLGDVDRTAVPDVEELMNDVCSQTNALRIAISGIGAFPNEHGPSVVWAGVADADPLVEIAAELESRLEPLGFPRETRGFTPHLTLARIRRPRHRGRSHRAVNLGDLFSRYGDQQFGGVDIDRVVLFRSQIEPGGPVYSELHSAPLQRR